MLHSGCFTENMLGYAIAFDLCVSLGLFEELLNGLPRDTQSPKAIGPTQQTPLTKSVDRFNGNVQQGSRFGSSVYQGFNSSVNIQVVRCFHIHHMKAERYKSAFCS